MKTNLGSVILLLSFASLGVYAQSSKHDIKMATSEDIREFDKLLTPKKAGDKPAGVNAPLSGGDQRGDQQAPREHFNRPVDAAGNSNDNKKGPNQQGQHHHPPRDLEPGARPDGRPPGPQGPLGPPVGGPPPPPPQQNGGQQPPPPGP